jgi:hypothetical protein|tara:strand:+ start:94 stop:840 length:747 start_codon:yes stop_codon:yes gene_type:complete
MENETKFKFPTEVVELPSKGLLYPKDHPLSSGTVELKYMTAKEEDILTNQNYLRDGTVIDKLLKSLLVTKFPYDDLLVGDKNAILISSRILGYGKDYEFTYKDELVTVDLSLLNPTYLTPDQLNEEGLNEFSFTLPFSQNEITFKFLTGHDEKKIEDEIKGLKRINKGVSPTISTRLKHQILSVNGNDEKKSIREFVDNMLLARDSSALRKHIKDINPDVKMQFIPDEEGKEAIIPMEAGFLWPDTNL